MIRKATHSDIDAIVHIYNKVLDLEEQGELTIGWQRGVYPTRATALQAIERGDIFVNEQAGKLLAAAIINHQQMPTYAKGHWAVAANDDEVMVLHTLVVDPDCAGRGIGTEFVDYYEHYAKAQGAKDLRMDTQAKNTAARALYHRLGYKEVGIVPCAFNGIPGVSLVLLEKPI